jgi:hypothetical protein
MAVANTLAYYNILTITAILFFIPQTSELPLSYASALLVKNRLGWKRIKVANTIVYWDVASITALKSFIA